MKFREIPCKVMPPGFPPGLPPGISINTDKAFKCPGVRVQLKDKLISLFNGLNES